MSGKGLPTLLVTGASGNIGKALVHRLAAQHQGRLNVVYAVHSKPTASTQDLAALRSRSSAVVELDYDQPASVAKALEPVRRIDMLFLVPSHAKDRARQAATVIDAVRAKGVKLVVLVSLLGCQSRAGLFASQFRDIEEYIEAIGIPHVFLRCSPLQHNFLTLLKNFDEPIATIAMPIGLGGYAPIHVADIAAAAAAVLVDPEDHAGKTYTLTGPEVLTGVSIAGKASRGLERPVRFINCTVDEARDAMLRAGTPEWIRNGFLELYVLIGKGFFATPSPDLAFLTCFKGTSMEEFFRENRAMFNARVKDSDGTSSSSSSSSKAALATPQLALEPARDAGTAALPAASSSSGHPHRMRLDSPPSAWPRTSFVLHSKL
ncbi:hypothetical protein HK105_200974 [Polyrhizophydium stewartii]|uniref:NmrA-like domain-containing protein n=1 Tax=Polyrhizophydium stewartii TaxID=2732419 RepID=A0ABR4NIK6_9FUNG